MKEHQLPDAIAHQIAKVQQITGDVRLDDLIEDGQLLIANLKNDSEDSLFYELAELQYLVAHEVSQNDNEAILRAHMDTAFGQPGFVAYLFNEITLYAEQHRELDFIRAIDLVTLEKIITVFVHTYLYENDLKRFNQFSQTLTYAQATSLRQLLRSAMKHYAQTRDGRDDLYAGFHAGCGLERSFTDCLWQVLRENADAVFVWYNQGVTDAIQQKTNVIGRGMRSIINILTTVFDDDAQEEETTP